MQSPIPYRKLLVRMIFLITLTVIIYSCQDAERLNQDIYYTNGRDIYIKKCQNCHGDKGQGLGQLVPPLTDTVYLKENKRKIACFIKNGMSEKIMVHGQSYEDKMPAFPEMANIDIAQVTVYISNSFGNNQGMYTTEAVAADLKACP